MVTFSKFWRSQSISGILSALNSDEALIFASCADHSLDIIRM